MNDPMNDPLAPRGPLEPHGPHAAHGLSGPASTASEPTETRIMTSSDPQRLATLLARSRPWLLAGAMVSCLSIAAVVSTHAQSVPPREPPKSPADQLRARVRQIADSMLEKNPHTLKAAKDAIKRVAEMTVDASEDYLVVRQEALNYLDKSEDRKQGLKQFIDDKTYRPGLGAYKKS